MPKDILAHVTDMVDEGCRVCRRVQAEGIQVLSLITRDPHSLTQLASAQEREKWAGAVKVRNMPSCMHTCTHSVSCSARASQSACLSVRPSVCLSVCMSVCLSVSLSVCHSVSQYILLTHMQGTAMPCTVAQAVVVH